MSLFKGKTEYLFAGVSILLWSTIVVAAKLLQNGLNNMQIVAASSLLAFVFLFAVCLFTGRLKQLRSLRAKELLILSGVGLLGTFVYHLLLYSGIAQLQPSQAIIINYLWPIMIVLFACLLLKEPLTARKLLAIGLSFLGVAVVTAGGDLLHIETKTLLGALYCVLAAVSYGLYSVLNKRLHVDELLAMTVFYAASTLVSFGWIALRGDWFTPDLPQFAGLVWMGVFTYAIAYITWALAIDRGDTAKIANTAYLTPFLTLLWTSLLPDEPFSIWSLLGLLLILAGVFIQLRGTKQSSFPLEGTVARRVSRKRRDE